MPRIVIFDVNETLLDLSGLRPVFVEVFGSPEPMGEWFARMLHASLVANHLDTYRPFGELGVDQLMALAHRQGVDLDRPRAADVVAAMRSLPAHPDVAPGLDALRTGGHRLATLTNGSPDAVAAQLDHAGIADRFEAVFSVEAVRRFKPAPEPYHHAVAELGVPPDAVTLVAAHDWDVAGALAAGLGAMFLARPGASWSLPDPPPTPVVADLADLVRVLDQEQHP